jgi:hypothetical protein
MSRLFYVAQAVQGYCPDDEVGVIMEGDAAPCWGHRRRDGGYSLPIDEIDGDTFLWLAHNWGIGQALRVLQDAEADLLEVISKEQVTAAQITAAVTAEAKPD